ncbi:DUF4349 domain-containing protein [Chryseobacterium tructae]|uniref:DUF4349 domain-containing protein n=1 Tax=Chryseobacterium tructae TaxID=1037380 RepID=A0ABV7XYW7_9FLAO|nr:DUF4349 domain-containing protein [Chryseobacterium tructae]MDN3693921.1 DUF4349 domain-containing protein [Chryseobacterium tructae]
MRTILLPLLCLILINCSKQKADKILSANADIAEMIIEDKVAGNTPPPPPSAAEEPDNSNATTSLKDSISRKIIKNGEMRVQVGDIKKAQSQVNDILKNNRAYIEKEEFENTDINENMNLTIRVPHKNFDALVNSFSDGVGSVLSKNISSNDVTEEYTDVSIKLANKKIYLEKYRDMLKSAATTKDMLEIQEKIRALEDEIDVAEGRLRFIDDRVNYSTLNLSLYKAKIRSSATSKIGFGSRFVDSLTEGWNSFIAFLLGIISFWPFFLLIPVIVALWRKWKKKKQ